MSGLPKVLLPRFMTLFLTFNKDSGSQEAGHGRGGQQGGGGGGDPGGGCGSEDKGQGSQGGCRQGQGEDQSLVHIGEC